LGAVWGGGGGNYLTCLSVFLLAECHVFRELTTRTYSLSTCQELAETELHGYSSEYV